MPMITKTDLTRIYSSEFFEDGETSNIVVRESQLTNRGVDLEEVCLNGISGYWLKISPNWLKESCGPYRSKVNGLKLFRRDCDSILFFSYEGQEYAVWLELKSGYDSVAGDAIFQVVGSYVRSKTYLNAFEAFASAKPKELFLIVSHPKETVDIANVADGNAAVKANKKSFVPDELSASDKIAQIYRRRLLAGHGVAMLQVSDFHLDALGLSPSVIFSKLPLLHLTCSDTKSVIDISDILEKVKKVL